MRSTGLLTELPGFDRSEAAGLKWQVDQALRNLDAEKKRGEALAREREGLAKLRGLAEQATHNQARPGHGAPS